MSSSESWVIDRSISLGSGGFGQVYRAVDPEGNERAVKILPRESGGSRDLLAADLPRSPHIVPVLHTEETDDEIHLFMPRAERSLRARLQDDDPVHAPEALQILQDIAAGLVEIEASVVHRDLKPENVLWLDGRWAICDFGIARYAEASTATETQKHSMTAPYAAPEQWRNEHATAATDVYAFGVIAYEVVSGHRPYPGPSRNDFREQHLNGEIVKPQTTKRLSALIMECLFISPGARPPAQNLAARLAAAGEDARRPGASALADAHQAMVEAAAAEQRAEEVLRSEGERRTVLAQAGEQLFAQVVAELVEAIDENAPAARVSQPGDGSTEVRFGQARLTISPLRRVPYPLDFDVIVYTSIFVIDIETNQQRSHSYYYTNFDKPASYQWYELAFSSSFDANFTREPRALRPQDGMSALGTVVTTTQLGRPIVALDLGDLDDFVDQWMTWFGLTAQGRLPRPNQLPEGTPVRPTRHPAR